MIHEDDRFIIREEFLNMPQEELKRLIDIELEKMKKQWKEEEKKNPKAKFYNQHIKDILFGGKDPIEYYNDKLKEGKCKNVQLNKSKQR